MLRCRLSKAASCATSSSKTAAAAIGVNNADNLVLFLSSGSTTTTTTSLTNKSGDAPSRHYHTNSHNNNNGGVSLFPTKQREALILKRSFGLGRERPSARFPTPFDADGTDDDDDDDDDELDFDNSSDFFYTTPPPTKKEQEAKAAAQAEAEAEAQEEERLRIQEELDNKTGRLWTDDWELTDEHWSQKVMYDDLPDWDRSLCSRVSKERVKVYQDGIPTIQKLSTLTLPPPPPLHPTHSTSNPKKYAKYRKNHNSSQIYDTLTQTCINYNTHIAPILKLDNWQEKQIAVDALYEEMYDAVQEKEDILKSHPSFRKWVDRALERYLKEVAQKEEEESKAEEKASETKDEQEKKEEAVPIFVELLDSHNNQKNNTTFQGGEPQYKPIDPDMVDPKSSKQQEKVTVVPSILYPLQIVHHEDKELVGRMVEEWELTADDDCRRIMMRDCMKEIAKSVDVGSGEGEESGTRVFVNGKRGVGKTAALATIVASARTSGNIVLYLPDGDRLRKLGFYIEPNSHRKGLYDLPVLAKEVCTQLLTSHKHDMDGMVVNYEGLQQFLSHDQISKIRSGSDDENDKTEDGPISLIHLLTTGSTSNSLSSGCYSAAIHMLMNQTSKPFVVVMDEFNCYYDHGHYFHADYDENVYHPIPCDIITLFKPLLDAIAIHPDAQVAAQKEPVVMKRGAIVVGCTESRAVAGKFTQGLNDAAMKDDGVHVVNVPRYSKVEVDHILAHFEVVGIGRLRFDRGETVMNEQEVAYLNMLSGGVGQYLLNACII